MKRMNITCPLVLLWSLAGSLTQGQLEQGTVLPSCQGASRMKMAMESVKPTQPAPQNRQRDVFACGALQGQGSPAPALTAFSK